MNRTPPQALLYVPPKMTKTEVKEYLTKIYSVNVLAVMTANFLGENTSYANDFLHPLDYCFSYYFDSQVNGNDFMERGR